jgi:hypothetical protein
MEQCTYVGIDGGIDGEIDGVIDGGIDRGMYRGIDRGNEGGKKLKEEQNNGSKILVEFLTGESLYRQNSILSEFLGFFFNSLQ